MPTTPVGNKRGENESLVQPSRDDVVRRLKRIEGQVRGIQRMVQDDRASREILDQLSAVNQAVRGVSALVAENYACQCIENATGKCFSQSIAGGCRGSR